MIGAAVLALLAASSAQAGQPVDCRYDREALLAMGYADFDQSPHGWRSLAQGCDAEAADLIRDWRLAHKTADTILYWHEGQARAMAGQTGQAIELFRQSREQVDPFGWNAYVDGSIAFLRRDRDTLLAAHDELAALPVPEDWPPVSTDGKRLDVDWPMNLTILDGFLRCWDRPYNEAYSCPAE